MILCMFSGVLGRASGGPTRRCINKSHIYFLMEINLMNEIILTTITLTICWVIAGIITDLAFGKREKIKVLPRPSNLTYEILKDMYEMCLKNRMYEASEAFYFGFGECLFDFDKYKSGLKKDIERQDKQAEIELNRIRGT